MCVRFYLKSSRQQLKQPTMFAMKSKLRQAPTKNKEVEGETRTSLYGNKNILPTSKVLRKRIMAALETCCKSKGKRYFIKNVLNGVRSRVVGNRMVNK